MVVVKSFKYMRVCLIEDRSSRGGIKNRVEEDLKRFLCNYENEYCQECNLGCGGRFILKENLVHGKEN